MSSSRLNPESAYVQELPATTAFPVRYWLLVIYTVGIPGFLRFDQSGKTHKLGLFNAQSISGIALTLGVFFVFLVLSSVSRQPLLVRPVRFAAAMWVALLLVFAIASASEPSFRLSHVQGTDIVLSFYRLGEWMLAFLMLLSLYSRQPYARTSDFVAGLIFRVCWIRIAIVWLVLPFAPSFVYTASDEDGIPRLGGLLFHPVALGVISAIACLHAIVFLTGTKRAFAVCLSLLTLALTYARGAEVTLLFSLLAYSIFFSKALPRLLGFLVSVLAIVAGVSFSTSVLNYAGRGNGVQNALTLSDRVQVWAASMDALEARPWTGYGFVAGAKSALKDYWPYTHWVPPNAHNDLIQTALSGGVVAGFLWIALMVYGYGSAVKLVRLNRRYAFFLFTLLQLSSFSFLVPLVGSAFEVLGGLFLFCFVLVVDHASNPCERSTEALWSSAGSSSQLVDLGTIKG